MAPNAIAPAVSATRASDDEILGLAPNAVRKTNRMVATKNAVEKASATSPQANADDFFAGLESEREHREVSDALAVMVAKGRRTFALAEIRKN